MQRRGRPAHRRHPNPPASPPPAEAVAYLPTAAPDRVQTWTVLDASHTQALATAPAEWTARVTAFLDRALGVVRS